MSNEPKPRPPGPPPKPDVSDMHGSVEFKLQDGDWVRCKNWGVWQLVRCWFAYNDHLVASYDRGRRPQPFADFLRMYGDEHNLV